MRPIPTEWLMRHIALDEEAPCLAGAAPTLTPNDIKDGWELTPEDRGYAVGAPCPDCGKPMTYDAGEPMNRDHPGEPESVGCNDCGMHYTLLRRQD